MMTSNANGLQGSSAQPASRLETWSMAKTSLAERLGYGADDRLQIVNCDDLGCSHGERRHPAGPGPWRDLHQREPDGALPLGPRGGPSLLKRFPVGVHLTLTSEYAGYRWRGLTEGSSLQDSEGRTYQRSRF